MSDSPESHAGDAAATPDGTPGQKSTPATPAADTDTTPATDATPPAERVRLLGLRRDIPFRISAAAAAACLAMVTGLWWYATTGEPEERLLSFTQLPSIPETLDYLPRMWDSSAPERHLLNNTLVSLRRVVIGFALALIVGVPLGIGAGCFALLRSFLSPLILFGRNIPVAALTAVVFAFFGTGELEKVMFIFIACVAFIISDTVDAVKDVAERYVETALTLGATRLQVVSKVLVPLAMPSVFNAVRVMFGLAFGYIMLVEIVQEGGGAGGLGFLLNVARRRATPQVMVIIILSIPLVAWLIDQLLYVVQCALFRWKYAREAEKSMVFRGARILARAFWRPKQAAASPTVSEA